MQEMDCERERDKDELLTIKDLMVELKVGRSKAYDLASEIGITWIGSSIRVRRSRLEAWLETQDDEEKQ